MKYSTKTPPDTYFVVNMVNNPTDATDPNGYTFGNGGDAMTNFGVLLDKETEKVLEYFICNIEIMSDDRNILSGLGRVTYETSQQNFGDEQYADCSEFGSATLQYGYVVYSY
jgi:hypothetical protein